MAVSMVLTTMSLNSDASPLSCCEPKKAMPRPSVKEKTRAVITSVIGGISMVKKGRTSSACAISDTDGPPVISFGKTSTLVR